MPAISSPPAVGTYPPLPPPVAGIDINFCKNPRCRNFGVPAEIISHRRLAGTPLITTPGKAYKRFSRAKIRAEGFFVRTDKTQTVREKSALVKKAQRLTREFHKLQPHLTWEQARIEVMKISMANPRDLGPWKDPWCAHPWPTMSEPNKCVCWLTNPGNYDLDYQAQLHLKSSLAAVDNIFQRIRRSLDPLEWPLKTANAVSRTWYGYSPYNPRTAQTLLGIYRVIHNWMKVGDDGKTPAMRLGMSTAPAKPEDIIYFEDSGATSRIAREASARRKSRGPTPSGPCRKRTLQGDYRPSAVIRPADWRPTMGRRDQHALTRNRLTLVNVVYMLIHVIFTVYC